jgi:hypothetical protein
MIFIQKLRKIIIVRPLKIEAGGLIMIGMRLLSIYSCYDVCKLLGRA